jgi:hypothetical protein
MVILIIRFEGGQTAVAALTYEQYADLAKDSEDTTSTPDKRKVQAWIGTRAGYQNARPVESAGWVPADGFPYLT